MTTLAFALMAFGCFFLWWRKAQWAWALVMAALVVGVIVFVRDVDFASKLGIQL